MYMKKNNQSTTTPTNTATPKKKVLKKTAKTAKEAVTAPAPPVLPTPGKYAAPAPTLPLGSRDGRPVLKKGFRYPSGVSEERKIEAFSAVLYAGGKKGTM